MKKLGMFIYIKADTIIPQSIEGVNRITLNSELSTDHLGEMSVHINRIACFDQDEVPEEFKRGDQG